MKYPRVICSGAQTGADQGGLAAAKAIGRGTTGYMPKGWLTDEGPRPDLGKEYNLLEAASSSYPQRTKWNVLNSDATVVIGDETSAGSALTIRTCVAEDKPYYVIKYPPRQPIHELVAAFRQWLCDTHPEVLNVAGNRERKNPGIFHFTKAILMETIEGGDCATQQDG